MFKVIEARLSLEEPTCKPLSRIVAVKSHKSSAQAVADRMNRKQDLNTETKEVFSYYVSDVVA